jgi:hypothetical protein
MSGAIPPLSQYTFIAWCLVKIRDNFTVYFISLRFMKRRVSDKVNLRSINPLTD